jgi:hypothetical protein
MPSLGTSARSALSSPHPSSRRVLGPARGHGAGRERRRSRPRRRVGAGVGEWRSGLDGLPFFWHRGSAESRHLLFSALLAPRPCLVKGHGRRCFFGPGDHRAQCRHSDPHRQHVHGLRIRSNQFDRRGPFPGGAGSRSGRRRWSSRFPRDGKPCVEARRGERQPSPDHHSRRRLAVVPPGVTSPIRRATRDARGRGGHASSRLPRSWLVAPANGKTFSWYSPKTYSLVSPSICTHTSP